MFPRPSRFTRLSILAATIFSFVAFFYLLTPAFVDSVKGGGFEFTRYITTATATKVVTESSTKKASIEEVEDTYQKYKSVLLEPQHPVNPHDFRYIHNPSGLCRGRERNQRQQTFSSSANSNGASPNPVKERPVTLLVYIHTAPRNLKKRQAVRQTWGHPTLLRRLDAAVVFLLGRPAQAKEQALVDLEAHEYGDLVQEDFVDAYRNLTYKGVAALRWVSLFCPSAVFLLKTDDDILVDIVSLVADLRKRYPGYPPPSSSSSVSAPGSVAHRVVVAPPLPKRVILCNLWTRMKVMRDPKSKWFIPPSEFAPDYFPPYCSGSAFVLSADLASRLYRVSLDKPFFWVDDYYVTGILVNSLGVPHARYNDVYLLNANLAEGQLKNDTGKTLFFHVKKLSLFLKLWPLLLRRHASIPELRDLMPTTHATPSSIVGEAPTHDPVGRLRPSADGTKPNAKVDGNRLAKEAAPDLDQIIGSIENSDQVVASETKSVRPARKENPQISFIKADAVNGISEQDVNNHISREQNSAYRALRLSNNKRERPKHLQTSNVIAPKNIDESSDVIYFQKPSMYSGRDASSDAKVQNVASLIPRLIPSSKQKYNPKSHRRLGKFLQNRRLLFTSDLDPPLPFHHNVEDQREINLSEDFTR